MNLSKYSDPISYHTQSDPSGTVFLTNKDYHQLLEKIGFNTFDSIWNYNKGDLVKEKGERRVIKVQFPPKDDQVTIESTSEKTHQTYYIKKHRQQISLWHKFVALLSPNKTFTEGLTEFSHYCNFRKNGLGTAIPVAAGMKKTSFFHVESFLITQDYSPFVDLEYFILNKPSTLQGTPNQQKRKNILKAIALYARKMHDSNLNHKDFNATHILLHDIESNQPEVALFDLQHVNTNRFSKFRWPIKALAELNFSLPSFIFNEEDKVFLFRNYKNISNLSLMDRLKYYCILKKTERIARHSKKRGLAPKAHPSS